MQLHRLKICASHHFGACRLAQIACDEELRLNEIKVSWITKTCGECKFRRLDEDWRYGVDMMLCKCAESAKDIRSAREEDFIHDLEWQWHDTQNISPRQLKWLKGIYQDIIRLHVSHGNV